jgi:hypothetical protein
MRGKGWLVCTKGSGLTGAFPAARFQRITGCHARRRRTVPLAAAFTHLWVISQCVPPSFPAENQAAILIPLCGTGTGTHRNLIEFLALASFSLHSPFVVGFLRTVGILNAAVWFGSVIFFTFAAAPAFFSEEMIRLLGRPYAGAAAQIVVHRYFLLQMWCAGIGLAHLIAEWLYTGRPFQRLTLILLMALFTIGILGGCVIEPRMRELHLKMYAVQTTPEVKDSARRSFRILHGASSALNLLVIGGVLVYLWHVTKPANTARFTSVNRFTT